MHCWLEIACHYKVVYLYENKQHYLALVQARWRRRIEVTRDGISEC